MKYNKVRAILGEPAAFEANDPQGDHQGRQTHKEKLCLGIRGRFGPRVPSGIPSPALLTNLHGHSLPAIIKLARGNASA